MKKAKHVITWLSWHYGSPTEQRVFTMSCIISLLFNTWNSTASQPIPYLFKYQMVFPLHFIGENAKISLNGYITGLFIFFVRVYYCNHPTHHFKHFSMITYTLRSIVYFMEHPKTIYISTDDVTESKFVPALQPLIMVPF